MIKNFKNKLILIGLIAFILLPAMVLAANEMESLLDQAAGTGGAGYNTSIDKETAVATLAGNVVKIALSFLGVIFICLIIYAGFLWMTAAGSEEKIDKAKKIMTAAIIGLIVILLSGAIYGFVAGSIITSST